MAMITVDLSDEALATLEAALAEGAYASIGDVLEAEVSAGLAGQALSGWDVEAIRTVLAEGDASGPTISVDEVLERRDQRLRGLIAEAEADVAAGRLVEFDPDAIAELSRTALHCR